MKTYKRNSSKLTLDLREQSSREYLETKGYFTLGKIPYYIAISGIIYFIITVFLGIAKVGSYELSIQDKIRLERMTACQQAIKEEGIADNQLDMTEKVIDCAVRMTGVYIVESGYGKHEIRKNNFLGIKRTVNGVYGFHSFETGYDCRLEFARKWSKYHYNKTSKTFIYGFWIDGEWKYGWSATQKDTYTQILQSIESNQELRRQYEYLYFTN